MTIVENLERNLASESNADDNGEKDLLDYVQQHINFNNKENGQKMTNDIKTIAFDHGKQVVDYAANQMLLRSFCSYGALENFRFAKFMSKTSAVYQYIRKKPSVYSVFEEAKKKEKNHIFTEVFWQEHFLHVLRTLANPKKNWNSILCFLENVFFTTILL